jgi:hypothetical protein
MPVTAKLSRKFYETFGDDIANELVEWFNTVDAAYRMDLREFNDANFARFDAKLEQRLAERFAASDRRWEQRFSAADLKWERRFAALDLKVEQRFAESDLKLEQRFAESDLKWEHRFAESDLKWEQRFTDFDIRVARQFARVDVQMADLRVEIARSETRVIRWMVGLWLTTAIGLLGLYLR